MTECFLTKNRCYTKSIPLKVQGLMLHSVGCAQPSPAVFCKNWDNASASKCVHAFIDGSSGEVVQTLPWEVKGWHCGASGNSSHIGIEMCESDAIRYDGNHITVLDRARAVASARCTYEAAIVLFATLCRQFGLDPMRDICSHAEGYKSGIASDHGDPEHYWRALELGYTMNTFRAAVRKAMGQLPTAQAARQEQKKEVTMKTLKKGAKGVQVRVLQYILNWKGYDCGSIDGSFGPKTDKALRGYQQKQGLTVDGCCGSKTWGELLDE